MWLPSASVVSRVTTMSPLMGTPVTTLFSSPSPNSWWKVTIGPPGPGPWIITAPIAIGGGGGGASLCAAASELKTANNRPHNDNIEMARRLADLPKFMTFPPNSISTPEFSKFSSQYALPAPGRRRPQRHRRPGSQHWDRSLLQPATPFALLGRRWSRSMDHKTSKQRSPNHR